MANINVTVDQKQRPVLEGLVTMDRVYKQVSSIFVTEDRVYKQVSLEKTLSSYTWAEISAISAAGLASHVFAVGETKRVTSVSGNADFTAQIAGFDHDDLADGSGKAGITFIAASLMDRMEPMHITSTAQGFLGTYMYNTTLPSIRGTLPESLLAVLKPITKVSYNYMDGSYTDFSTDFWLPSAYELSGTGPTDGKLYELYTASGSNGRIKSVYGASTAVPYWTRTQAAAFSWSRVVASGAMGTYTTTQSSYMPLSFCI